MQTEPLDLSTKSKRKVQYLEIGINTSEQLVLSPPPTQNENNALLPLDPLPMGYPFFYRHPGATIPPALTDLCLSAIPQAQDATPGSSTQVQEVVNLNHDSAKYDIRYVCHGCGQIFVTFQDMLPHWQDECPAFKKKHETATTPTPFRLRIGFRFSHRQHAEPGAPIPPGFTVMPQSQDATPGSSTQVPEVVNLNHDNAKYGIRYVCHGCGQIFVTTQDMLPHWQNECFAFKKAEQKFPPQEVHKFKCSFCAKTYKFKSNLANHTFIHTRPFQCKICKRDFSRPLYLERHMEKCQPPTETNFV